MSNTFSKTNDRRLRRFFSLGSHFSEGTEIILSPSETKHLKDVIRLSAGDECLVMNGQGHCARAKVFGFSNAGEARLMIQGLENSGSQKQKLYSRFFVSIPQKAKMEYLIEKCQELDVDEIVPMETSRTIVRLSASTRDKVITRWNKIALEASKQSGAPKLIRISWPCKLKDVFLPDYRSDKSFLFHPDGSTIPFPACVEAIKISLNKSENNAKIAVMNVFFGPEGGFSDEEAAMFSEKKIPVVSLGDNLLKVDTAVLGVAAAIKFSLL